MITKDRVLRELVEGMDYLELVYGNQFSTFKNAFAKSLLDARSQQNEDAIQLACAAPVVEDVLRAAEKLARPAVRSISERLDSGHLLLDQEERSLYWCDDAVDNIVALILTFVSWFSLHQREGNVKFKIAFTYANGR